MAQTKNSIKYKPNSRIEIESTKKFLILKAKNLNISKTTCPHLMLVARRIAKVIGRITTPIISKIGINNLSKPSIPEGKKCLIIIRILFLIQTPHKIKIIANA